MNTRHQFSEPKQGNKYNNFGSESNQNAENNFDQFKNTAIAAEFLNVTVIKAFSTQPSTTNPTNAELQSLIDNHNQYHIQTLKSNIFQFKPNTFKNTIHDSALPQEITIQSKDIIATINEKKQTIDIQIFFDGSYHKKTNNTPAKAAKGVFFQSKSALNRQGRTYGHPSSYLAELQALEELLLFIPSSIILSDFPIDKQRFQVKWVHIWGDNESSS